MCEIGQQALMYCRYSVDITLDKGVVNKDSLKDQKNRRRARTEVKKKFEERWACGLSLCGRGLLMSVLFFLQAQDWQKSLVLPEITILGYLYRH